MSPRNLALAVIAVAVLGMGVYLFVEVRSGSAAADPPPANVASGMASEPVTAATPAPAKPAMVKPVKSGEPAPSVGGGTPPPALDGDGAVDDVGSAGSGKVNPKLEAIMDQANKAYDRQDFDEAKAIAGKMLAKAPTNIRMLRIMVSSSCIDGDVAVAQKYFPQLPKYDREQMKARCDRYGVTLTDPPQ